MATPANTSTEITLAKVRNELATNSYGTAYTAGETSLYQASIGTYGTINTANASGDRPDGAAPHTLSEFYNYDHDLSSFVHETAITTGNTGGYGFAQSGYFQNNYGSITDDSIYLANVDQTITAFYSNSGSTTATSGVVFFRVVDSGGSDNTNGGWTTLYVYMNQSNGSGSADYTFSRTSANSFTGNGGVKTWTWNVYVGSSPYVYGTYFGGSTATNIYLEIE